MSSVMEEVTTRRPVIGERILWWNMGDKKVQPVPGVLCGAGINLIADIVTFGIQEPNRPRVSIPHMGDPRLESNVHLRQWGAWDYQDAAVNDALALRIAELEGCVGEQGDIIADLTKRLGEAEAAFK